MIWYLLFCLAFLEGLLRDDLHRCQTVRVHAFHLEALGEATLAQKAPLVVLPHHWGAALEAALLDYFGSCWRAPCLLFLHALRL